MTRRFRPCLLLDVGDTLMRRDRPGPKRRVLDLLQDEGVDPALDRAIADAILTAPDPLQAAASVARIAGLPPALQDAVHAVLVAGEGPATLVAGALDLLQTAAALGWRVLLASNAVSWAPPVPPPLRRRAEAYVSSSALGIAKQDSAFWRELCARHDIAAGEAVSIGDSPVADVASAQAAGIAALLAPPDLSPLARAIEQAGSPPEKTIAVLAGEASLWAGQSVLPGHGLEGLVTRATRARVTLRTRDHRFAAEVVRRSGGNGPLVTAPSATGLWFAWVALREDRRLEALPPDLRRALDHAGVSVDALTRADRRHAAAFVRESSTDAVRIARIAEIILALRRGSRDAG